MKKIKRVKKNETPSLLDTDKANEIIDRLNALSSVMVSPQAYGKWLVSDGNAVLDLSPLREQILKMLKDAKGNVGEGGGGDSGGAGVGGPPDGGSGGGGGEGGGGSGSSTTLATQVRQLQQRLDNASISVRCSGGQITATLSL